MPPEAIRALRLRAGLTQEEMAHQLCVTFSTINRWENGHSAPHRLALAALHQMDRDVTRQEDEAAQQAS